MAERRIILDKFGDWYSIELFEDQQYFAMRVYRGVQVGYARCVVDGDRVELTDIRINGRLERGGLRGALLKPFRRFMARNYQSRGIGTKLLTEVVAYAREIGATGIHGTLNGRRDLLARWFARNGFEVDEERGEVLLRLDA